MVTLKMGSIVEYWKVVVSNADDTVVVVVAVAGVVKTFSVFSRPFLNSCGTDSSCARHDIQNNWHRKNKTILEFGIFGIFSKQLHNCEEDSSWLWTSGRKLQPSHIF